MAEVSKQLCEKMSKIYLLITVDDGLAAKGGFEEGKAHSFVKRSVKFYRLYTSIRILYPFGCNRRLSLKIIFVMM